MVGIFGGSVSSQELAEMRSEMIEEPWYETTETELAEFAVGTLHHGTESSQPTVVTDDDVGGILFGTITNRSDVGTELFGELAADPESTLASLNGSFLAVWAVDGALNIATDCLASVTCLYRESEKGVVFGNELGALVAGMDDPRLDIDAAAEFLARDFVFGDQTLVEDVRRLQPGTLLTVDDDEVATRRYWSPSYAADERPSTVPEVLSAYRSEVRAVAETADGNEGMFLTGGLDSRLLAGVLRPELETFQTVTFDYNPVEKNIEPAKRVANLLSVPNSTERHSPEEFVESVRKSVRLTNGMVHWRNFFGFPFMLTKSRDRFDTLVANFGQGEFFGEYLGPNTLQTDSPVAALSSNTQKRGAGSYFADDVDIERGLREAVDDHDGDGTRETVHDVFLTSFYPWFHFSKLNLHRSQVDAELVLTRTDLIDSATRLPDDMRRRPVDLPLFDTILPTAPAKYELVRTLDGGLEDIPSNSLLPVDYPLLLHTLVYSTWRKLPAVSLEKPHLGYQRKAHRYREWLVHNERFRTFVDELLDSAMQRDCFDEGRLETIKSEQHSHPLRSHIEEISVITSIEILIQEFGLRC